jgi:hypothetical protein
MSGQPQLGTNPFLGIDAAGIDILDSAGTPGLDIIEKAASTTFQLRTAFNIGGLARLAFKASNIPYTVTYIGEGVGVADVTFGTVAGPAFNSSVGVVNGPVVEYKDANTTATVNTGGLANGVYKLVVLVSFGTWPIKAFSEGGYIEIVD